MTAVSHVNLARGFRGGERQTELLVRGLAERGWEQVLIARRGEPLADRLKTVTGVEVREVSNNFLSAARATSGSALVHAHEGRAGQAALLASLVSRTPYLITRRIPNMPSDRFFTRAIYRRASHIVCISEAVTESMEAFAPETPKSLIYSALGYLPSDPEAVRAIRARFPGRILAGNVAALNDAHKGQRVLIEAARKLSAERPGVMFLLVGAGPDEAELKAQAADLPNVVFEGYRENVGDYLAAFDLLVFPSREEGLGSTVLDAMHFGLPVVASSAGGIPEIVSDGETGYLVPPGDAGQLADQVARVIDDPGLRRRMGAAARVRAEAFRPEHMVSAYAELYRQLLGETGEAGT
ncbi:MAG: glycosyltransferase family 4 protein [Gammaproteobacteria bacterium]